MQDIASFPFLLRNMIELGLDKTLGNKKESIYLKNDEK